MKTKPWAVGLAALALLSVSACGGTADENGDAAASESPSASPTEELEVLTEEQAEQALIPETTMGDEFKGIEPTDDDTEVDLGCLNALDELEELDAETEAEIEYVPADDSGFPALEHSVFSYSEPEVISDRIEEVTAALDGCDSVDVTDDEGTRFALDVSFESGATTDGADEQVSLQASGTIATPDQEVPISLYLSAVRVDNHVTAVIYSELSDDVTAGVEQFDSYVTEATARLAAVASGETPE